MGTILCPAMRGTFMTAVNSNFFTGFFFIVLDNRFFYARICDKQNEKKKAVKVIGPPCCGAVSRCIFSVRERKSPAESFLKFRYVFEVPTEAASPKPCAAVRDDVFTRYVVRVPALCGNQGGTASHVSSLCGRGFFCLIGPLVDSFFISSKRGINLIQQESMS